IASVTTNPGPRSSNAPSSFIDLGAVAVTGEQFSINTFGSFLDTEIAVYAADGTFISTNDDVEPGVDTTSEVIFGGEELTFDANGVPVFQSFGEGEYFVAVGEFDSIFGDDFGVSGDTDPGVTLPFNISVNGTEATGDIDGDFDGITWVRFEIIPTPGSATLLAFAGIAATRRRRA
ncbi:MAG: hypothetical protein AAGB34_10375, partial [Planctomycetota bacterium]